MTPKQAFRFMKANRMDFKELMLLEHMATYTEHVLTQRLVTDAFSEKISSPATTHKYVARLKRRKYVKDIRVKDQDERCHYIGITEAGKELLKQWSI